MTQTAAGKVIDTPTFIIHTKGGSTVRVDGDDYLFLKRFSWSARRDKKTSYAYTNIFIGGKSRSVAMHRMITGMRNCEVDHRNRDGLDNRKENLRFCTTQQNQCNRVRKNKFNFRGVYKPKKSQFYAYQIQAHGKKYVKNGFLTPADAARGYDEKSKELHGEFGIRNFKD
jgi:hypothetical protein